MLNVVLFFVHKHCSSLYWFFTVIKSYLLPRCNFWLPEGWILQGFAYELQGRAHTITTAKSRAAGGSPSPGEKAEVGMWWVWLRPMASPGNAVGSWRWALLWCRWGRAWWPRAEMRSWAEGRAMGRLRESWAGLFVPTEALRVLTITECILRLDKINRKVIYYRYAKLKK